MRIVVGNSNWIKEKYLRGRKMRLDLRGRYQLPRELVDKVRKVADYIIVCDATFKEASYKYSLSLGTIFNYMHTYLPKISKVRYISVLRIIERHKRFKRGIYFRKEGEER